MKRAFGWLWDHGIVSTFLAGLFAVLPLMITIIIISWMGKLVHGMLAPDRSLGVLLRLIGLQFVGNESVALWIGAALVLLTIWLVGAVVKNSARYRMDAMIHSSLARLPVLRRIYSPVAQVVSMMQQQDQVKMKSMSVVYCEFGRGNAPGFLGLLASTERYRFGEQECYVVYIPTSPVPMSGGLLFVPISAVRTVEMRVDELMQIYFSLGLMAATAIPARYQCEEIATPAAQ